MSNDTSPQTDAAALSAITTRLRETPLARDCQLRFQPDAGVACWERYRGDVDVLCQGCFAKLIADTIDRLTRELAAQATELAEAKVLLGAALADFGIAEVQRDAARADAVQAQAERDTLRRALEAIASHDGGRYNWVDGVAESKPMPQEIAEAALAEPREPDAARTEPT